MFIEVWFRFAVVPLIKVAIGFFSPIIYSVKIFFVGGPSEVDLRFDIDVCTYINDQWELLVWMAYHIFISIPFSSKLIESL
jgi:hypothetical protein